MVRSLKFSWPEILNARPATLGAPPCSRQTATVVAILESRKYGSWILLLPAPPCFGEDLLAVFLHFVDYGAGRACFLVPRTPNEQLQEHWGQVNSLLREPVVHLAAISTLGTRDDDPCRFELAQTIRQYVS